MICKKCGKFYFKDQKHIHAIVVGTERKELFAKLINQMAEVAEATEAGDM